MVMSIPWSYKTPRPVILEKDTLADYFARILRSGEDFSVTVFGRKRVGKSVTIANLIRKIAIINKKPFSIKNDIVFYKKDFFEQMQNAKSLTCKMLDDFGSELDSRRSMEESAVDISQYFHTSGTYQVGYFITTPTSGWINKDTRDRVANYLIWITGKNKRKGFCTALVWYLQRNEAKKKIYHHNLCLSPSGMINNKGIGYPITTWTLYPLPKELEQEYTPYRLEKADRNLDKGLDNIKKEENKTKKFNPREVAAEVYKNLDKYYYPKSNKGVKTFDKGLISVDYDIGDRKVEKILSVLMDKLRTENKLDTKTE